MKIHLVFTMAFCLCFLAGCAGGYGEDRYRKKTIGFLKLTPGAEYVIPFELYNSNNKSQWIGIQPVGFGDASNAPDIHAELSLINTSLVPMDIEVLGYGLSYVSKLIKPNDEQVLTTGKLPQALMLKNVTGIPKGIIKIKTLTVSNKPAGVKISKTIGRGGM